MRTNIEPLTVDQARARLPRAEELLRRVERRCRASLEAGLAISPELEQERADRENQRDELRWAIDRAEALVPRF